MRRYSPDQMEFLMAFLAVAVVGGVALPLLARVAHGWPEWLKIAVAALPLALMAAVVLVYWRRFRG